MQPAVFWTREDKSILCKLCLRRCKITKAGFCKVRIVKDSKLYTKNYLKFQLEEKSVEECNLFHFKPFTKSIEISSIGYNFPKSYKNVKEIKKYTTEKLLSEIRKIKAENVVFSFEPIIYFESFYKVVKFIFREGLNNIFSSNCYFPSQLAKIIGKYCSVALINIYSSLSEKYYKEELNVENIKPIIKTSLALKKQGMHLEFVNYVTKYGNYKDDLRKFCDFIVETFGSSVPLTLISFDNFYPQELSELKIIAEESGLRYVYVPEINEINTYCYNCKQLLIDRENKIINLEGDRCPNCGARIDIIL